MVARHVHSRKKKLSMAGEPLMPRTSSRHAVRPYLVAWSPRIYHLYVSGQMYYWGGFTGRGISEVIKVARVGKDTANQKRPASS